MKKSKFLSLLLTLLILVCTFMIPAMADDNIKVMLNGTELIFDVSPQLINGRTMVPLRKIFEELGAAVDWDNDTQTVTAQKDDIVIIMQIGNVVISVNEEEIVLDVPPQLSGSRTLVPVRAVAEGLNADVDWDNDAKTVIITKEEVDETLPTEPDDESEEPSVTEQSLMQLSDEDMKVLKSRYNNLIRYDFEQFSLPMSVLTDNADIIKEINKKSDTAVSFVEDVWNKVVISNIIDIQINSESLYLIDGSMDLEAAFLDIVKQAELEAGDYFDVSFESLKDKSIMMMVTFKNIDTMLACKYIGVTIKQDGKVRYFTAETDIMDKENLYFCEVTESARGTIGLMGFEKDDFINAVNKVVS